MQVTESEVANVLAITDVICAATGTFVSAPAAIEMVLRDDTVYLESPEGWFISVKVGRMKSSWWRPSELALTLTGCIVNAASGNMQEMVSEQNAPSLQQSFILREGIAKFFPDLEQLVVAIREKAAALVR